MSCTITVSEDGKYIIQKVVGNITGKKTIRYNIKTHIKGKELGINKYLVDMTESKNNDSAVNNYEFAYKDIRNVPEINKTARVATLIDPEDHSHDFILTAVKNSGLNNKLFTNREKAIQFLLDDNNK